MLFTFQSALFPKLILPLLSSSLCPLHHACLEQSPSVFTVTRYAALEKSDPGILNYSSPPVVQKLNAEVAERSRDDLPLTNTTAASVFIPATGGLI